MFYNLSVWFWYIFFFTVLTYLVWGFIIAFEVVLAMSGSRWAEKWIKAHHTYAQLYAEVKLFYPMILIGYFFLEIVPYYLFSAEKRAPFDMEELFRRLYGGDES